MITALRRARRVASAGDSGKAGSTEQGALAHDFRPLAEETLSARENGNWLAGESPRKAHRSWRYPRFGRRPGYPGGGDHHIRIAVSQGAQGHFPSYCFAGQAVSFDGFGADSQQPLLGAG